MMVNNEKTQAAITDKQEKCDAHVNRPRTRPVTLQDRTEEAHASLVRPGKKATELQDKLEAPAAYLEKPAKQEPQSVSKQIIEEFAKEETKEDKSTVQNTASSGANEPPTEDQKTDAEDVKGRLAPYTLSEYLRKRYIFKAFSAQERLAVYDNDRHVYIFMKKRHFMRFALSAFEGTPYKAKLTRNLIENVFMFLVHEGTLQASMNDFNRDEKLINFQNGVLDIETMTLQAHTAENLFTYVLAVNYNPKAKPPEGFRAMLKSMFKDEASMKLCLESMGYLLSNNTSAKKIVFFLGVPNSGKSTLARLLAHLYGDEAVSAIPLERFGGKFELGSAMCKRLNICPEVEKITPAVVRAVKAVSGGDKQMFEDKFEDAHFGFINLKFLWSGNTLPEIPARLKLDEGFFSRISIVFFPNTISESNRQDNFDVQLFKDEGEGIVRDLMAVLHAWYKNGRMFTKADISEVKLDRFRGYNTATERAFAKECIVFAEDGFVNNDALTVAYTAFCRKYGKSVRPLDHLKALLVKIFPMLKMTRKRMTKDGNPVAGISGIRLRDEKAGRN